MTDAERLDACGQDPSWICGWIADRTNSVWLAKAVEVAFERPLRIVFIVVLAYLASRLVRRFIGRFGRKMARHSLVKLAEFERRAPRSARRVAGPSVGTPAARQQADVGLRTASPPPSTETAADLESGPATAASAPVVVGNGRRDLRIDTLVAVLSSLSTMVVWAVAGLLVLAQFDVSLAPLFAGAGVLGVALGFGAQSVVADFLSGFFMLFEDQFGVGDVVDLGEASGTVENLSLRTSTIRDVNGTVWHIRNSEIRRVGNKSQLWSRAVLDIEVAYDTDLRRAQAIIQRVADELYRDPGFTKADILEPPEVWGVEQLGPDGVKIRLVLKTDPAEQWIVARELRLRIKEALDEAEIQIPFLHRRVWLGNVGTTPEATEEMAQKPD